MPRAVIQLGPGTGTARGGGGGGLPLSRVGFGAFYPPGTNSDLKLFTWEHQGHMPGVYDDYY